MQHLPYSNQFRIPSKYSGWWFTQSPNSPTSLKKYRYVIKIVRKSLIYWLRKTFENSSLKAENFQNMRWLKQLKGQNNFVNWTSTLGCPKLWRIMKNSLHNEGIYKWVNLTPMFFWHELLSTTSGPQKFAKISVFKVDNFVLSIFLVPK